jgi:PAS domain S-box-containing protein
MGVAVSNSERQAERGRTAPVEGATGHEDRVQGEEALMVSEARYRRLFESAEDGILILDAATGVVVDVNPFLVRLVGFSHEAILGKKVWELGFFRDIVANQEDFAKLQQNEYLRYEDQPLETADGRQIDVEFVSHAYHVDSSKVIQCTIRDITRRKRADEALEASAARFRNLLQEVQSVAVQGYGLDGTTQYWNQASEQLYGYSQQEAIGRNLVDLIIPLEMQGPVKEAMRQMAETGRPIPASELLLRRKDGSCVAVFSSHAIVQVPGRPPELFCLDIDLTERKQLEQERRVLEAQLRQQQKLESIGTLAGGVAHEINNPINGIMNYAQLIQDRLPADSPLAEYTGEILHETQRVANIVRNLLSFARTEKQRHSPARLGGIVEGTLSLIRTFVRHDQITLNVEVPEHLPEVRCHSQQIQQVLMNLMTNARDALNERYPGHDRDKVLNLEARLFEKEGRRWVRMTVEDHGGGMTPEVRERMFDPFFTTKPRDQGSGLGLAISHGIVKEHGGELTVESEPGRFTRINVDLPVNGAGEV